MESSNLNVGGWCRKAKRLETGSVRWVYYSCRYLINGFTTVVTIGRAEKKVVKIYYFEANLKLK